MLRQEEFDSGRNPYLLADHFETTSPLGNEPSADLFPKQLHSLLRLVESSLSISSMSSLDRRYTEPFQCALMNPFSHQKEKKEGNKEAVDAMLGRPYTEPCQCALMNPFSRQKEKKEGNKEAVDAMLVESMTQLSFKERQTVQEDLHGVSERISEDVNQMEIWLSQLDRHLNEIKNGRAYEIAEEMSPTYVSDRDFRVMFLRAQRYNPKAAAGQMIKFFDLKLKLFSKDKLVKDITLNDLDDDDKECLQNGSCQVLRRPDAARRPILFSIQGLRSYKNIKNEIRARFYIMMTIVESQEAQIRGAIILTYAVGQHKDKLNGDGYLDNVQLGLAIPLHGAGHHFCCSDYGDYILLYAAVSLFPAHVRARFTLHCGSHLECRYRLSAYGIPQDTLPLFFQSNEADLESHRRWCQERMRLETCGASSLPMEPQQNDVVFGGKISRNGGNLQLRSLAKRFSHSYDLASKVKRREVIESMIAEIHKSDGRFLQKCEQNGPWTEVPLEEVHKKVAMMFRNIRRPRAKRRSFAEAEAFE
eukprot:scaffold1384_cov116-Cylindrotheca_fusiformis.AAC.13